MNNSIDTLRDEEIIRERKSNATYDELAKEYGISRSRVAQICEKKKVEESIAKGSDDTDLDAGVKTLLHYAGALTIDTVSRYLDCNTMSEEEVCDYLNLDQVQLESIVSDGMLHTKKYGNAQIFYRKEVTMYKEFLLQK